jgi:hypothetical protein
MTISNPENLHFSDFARANAFDILTGHSWPTWTSTPPTTRSTNLVIWQPIDEFDYGVQIPTTSNYLLFFINIGTNDTFFGQETTTWNGETIFENWETYVSPYYNQTNASASTTNSNFPIEFYNARLLTANTPSSYYSSRTEDIPEQYFLGQINYDSADQPFEFQTYEIDPNTIQFRAVAIPGDY